MRGSDDMVVLLLTQDLMLLSQVQAAAARNAIELRSVSSIAQLPNSVDDQVNLVLLDLSFPGTEVATVIHAIRKTSATSPQVVAFGPHVHTGKLSAAREAGCDKVLSRGQFVRELNLLMGPS